MIRYSLYHFLHSEDVEGFTSYEDRKGIDTKNLFFKEVLYLYHDGCMFPCLIQGKDISIHAAVPRKYRGKHAMNAVKQVFVWIFKHLKVNRIVAQIEKTRHNVNMFARLVGMKKYDSNDIFNYYEVYPWAV